MALLKGEGCCIYIFFLKTPSLEDLSKRSTNVIFFQNTRIGPCRAIPFEQLTKIARKSTHNRIKLLQVYLDLLLRLLPTRIRVSKFRCPNGIQGTINYADSREYQARQDWQLFVWLIIFSYKCWLRCILRFLIISHPTILRYVSHRINYPPCLSWRYGHLAWWILAQPAAQDTTHHNNTQDKIATGSNPIYLLSKPQLNLT